MKQYYNGPFICSKNTSIKCNPSPYIKKFFSNNTKLKILDYGAGKYSRNANYLRDMGHEVYAYDPYNGSDCCGWDNCSNVLPDGRFDFAFTAFVLNVVPKHTEQIIVNKCEKYSDKCFHITRNRDLFISIKKALIKQDPTLLKYVDSFYKLPLITDEDILKLCTFGVQTIKGFQRIPDTIDNYNIITNNSGYKVYSMGF